MTLNHPVNKAALQSDGTIQTRGNKVFILANSKGGPGKTTTSINLLAAIALEILERKLLSYGIEGEKVKRLLWTLRVEKGMNERVLLLILTELLLMHKIPVADYQAQFSLPQFQNLLLHPILQEADIDPTFTEQLHAVGIAEPIIETLYTTIPDLRDIVQNETLLCEMDPQENASRGLNIVLGDGDKSMHDVLTNRWAGIDYAVRRTAYGVDMLPATTLMSELEVTLISNQTMRREFLLYDALYQARGASPHDQVEQAVDRYRVIFIDPPPSLGQLSLNATVPADGILAIIDMGVYSWDAMDQLKSRIELIRQASPTLDLVGLLCNRFDARPGFVLVANMIEEQARAEYGDKVFNAKIPYNASILNAPLYGMPVQYYEPSLSSTKTATSAYATLAREFLERFGI